MHVQVAQANPGGEIVGCGNRPAVAWFASGLYNSAACSGAGKEAACPNSSQRTSVAAWRARTACSARCHGPSWPQNDAPGRGSNRRISRRNFSSIEPTDRLQNSTNSIAQPAPFTASQPGREEDLVTASVRSVSASNDAPESEPDRGVGRRNISSIQPTDCLQISAKPIARPARFPTSDPGRGTPLVTVSVTVPAHRAAPSTPLRPCPVTLPQARADRRTASWRT